MKLQKGQKVTVIRTNTYTNGINASSVYEVLDRRTIVTHEWIQLKPSNSNILYWAREEDCVPYEEEEDHWLDTHWFGYGKRWEEYVDKRSKEAKRPECDCGAAAIGNIPHYRWCSVAHLEKIAKKRKPRHEFD